MAVEKVPNIFLTDPDGTEGEVYHKSDPLDMTRLKDLTPLKSLNLQCERMDSELDSLRKDQDVNRGIVRVLKTSVLPGVTIDLDICCQYIAALGYFVNRLGETMADITQTVFQKINSNFDEAGDLTDVENGTLLQDLSSKTYELFGEQLASLQNLLAKMSLKVEETNSDAQMVALSTKKIVESLSTKEYSARESTQNSNKKDSEDANREERGLKKKTEKPSVNPADQTPQKEVKKVEFAAMAAHDAHHDAHHDAVKWNQFLYLNLESNTNDKPGGSRNQTSTVQCVLHIPEDAAEKDYFECVTNDRVESSFTLGEFQEVLSDITVLRWTSTKTLPQGNWRVAIPCKPFKKDVARTACLKVSMGDGEWDVVKTKVVSYEHENQCIKCAEFTLSSRVEIKAIVVSVLKENTATINGCGGQIVSCVDQRISFKVPTNAFSSDTNLSLKVQPIESATLLEFESFYSGCYNVLSMSALYHLTTGQPWSKCVTVSLPSLSTKPKLKNSAKKSSTWANKKTEAAENEGEKTTLILVIKTGDDEGEWVALPDTQFIIKKGEKGEILSFQLMQPVHRFAILNMRHVGNGPLDGKAAKFITKIETFLNKKLVSFIMCQKTDDPSQIIIDCIPYIDHEKILSNYESEGYQWSQEVSPRMLLDEGQRIDVAFSCDIHKNNIRFDGCQAISYHMDCAMNAMRRDCQIIEIDKYAQKSRDYYRGILQFSTKEELPRSDETDRTIEQPLSSRRQSKYEENDRIKRAWPSLDDDESAPLTALGVLGTTILYEAAVTIPKPPQEDPTPLTKAPLDMVTRDGVIDKELFETLSQALGTEWPDVLYQLGVGRSKLEQIKRQNYQLGTARVIYDGLLAWFKSTSKSTDKVWILCNVLYHCGREDVAQAILEKETEYQAEERRKLEVDRLRFSFKLIMKSPEIVRDWKGLAKELSLPDTDLAEIDYLQKTDTDRCECCLTKWLENDRASMKLLVKTLRRSKHKLIAESIENHFGMKR